jgi:transcriptional regulator with XRE-family HTH domain
VRLIPGIIRFLGYCPHTPALPITEWLKLIRYGLGYSQRKLAGRPGIDDVTLRRWEADSRQPSPEYPRRITAFFERL